MSAANRRAALGALDRVRPLVAGLHRNRPNEELASDLVQAWGLTEVALRALLGGSTLAGQALVREVRQRELLTLEQAHALVAFQSARDRAELPGHQVSASDVDAARAAVAELDQAVGGVPATAEEAVPPAPTPTIAGAGGRAGAGPVTGAPVTERRRGIPAGAIMGLVALLLVVVVLGGWWMYERRAGGPRSLEAAEQLYASGDRAGARLAWARIAEARPELALPHVYLARIARDQGDVAAAQQELQKAIELDPRSSVAQREMGSLLLATGNPDLARRFYARAVELNPNDRAALGYLGCSLVRIGQPDLARTFLNRAGPGDWTACVSAPPPAPYPAGPTVAAPLPPS